MQSWFDSDTETIIFALKMNAIFEEEIIFNFKSNLSNIKESITRHIEFDVLSAFYYN